MSNDSNLAVDPPPTEEERRKAKITYDDLVRDGHVGTLDPEDLKKMKENENQQPKRQRTRAKPSRPAQKPPTAEVHNTLVLNAGALQDQLQERHDTLRSVDMLNTNQAVFIEGALAAVGALLTSAAGGECEVPHYGNKKEDPRHPSQRGDFTRGMDF